MKKQKSRKQKNDVRVLKRMFPPRETVTSGYNKSDTGTGTDRENRKRKYV